jgi:hypothetical protein
MVNNLHQYQQSEKSSVNSDSQQIHEYQQSEQIPQNSDGQQFTPISRKRKIISKQ